MFVCLPTDERSYVYLTAASFVFFFLSAGTGFNDVLLALRSLANTVATMRAAALAVCAAALFRSVGAATVSYDFNVTWVTANPDSAFDRRTIGINGQWPLPPITADVGDDIVVRVTNQLGNQSTSLHFHGLFQNGTTHMDGPADVTQCEIVPGASFTYNFTVCPNTSYLPNDLHESFRY